MGWGWGRKGWWAGWELLLDCEAASKALPLHAHADVDAWWRWCVLHRSVSHHERLDYVCQAAGEEHTRVGGGGGTKPVWVTLAGFQEGLNLS